MFDKGFDHFLTAENQMSKQDKIGKKNKALDELAKEAEFLDRVTEEDSINGKPKFGISNAQPELEIGRRLQEKREAQKITQGELAELSKHADPEGIGISRAVISMYEVGKNRPSPRELRILCEVLRISPNYLIYGDEDPFDELGDEHRWGYFSTSDPEFNALLLYVFQSLHKHHKLAIMQIINGLLLGWGKGAVESHQDEANIYLINQAEELRLLLNKRKKQ
jgi:transcriptional regulator with XRE-family HTH domain